MNIALEPAFPVNTASHDLRGALDPNYGMSMLAYFAARAPAEPQPWFSAVMPTSRPALPMAPADMSDNERREKTDWGDFIDTEDLKEPRIRVWAEAYAAAREAASKWDREASRQRYIQWPRAWAEAVIETLN